jgi:hypothetical protein
MASAHRLETILPWRVRIRGIVVVGQPPLGTPGTEMVHSTWTRAEAFVMSMGAQNMDFDQCGP